jgi:hypothetical protein
MNAKLRPAPAMLDQRLSWVQLIRELSGRPPNADDPPYLARYLHDDYLASGTRAPWLWLTAILQDRGHVSALTEGSHPLREWLLPAYTAGWTQRAEAPGWVKRILLNRCVGLMMWPWKDFNPASRYGNARYVSHVTRIKVIEAAAESALGPPRSSPPLGRLAAAAVAAERFRFHPEWHEKASRPAHAAQIVFEAFWLGLIQGSRRRPNAIVAAALMELPQ